MSPDDAETVGLQALAWLLGQEELLPVFLGATGAAADDLRARAADPEFLGAVLDFLLMDDAWVMGFCGDSGLAFTRPAAARAALPGGGQMHWT